VKNATNKDRASEKSPEATLPQALDLLESFLEHPTLNPREIAAIAGVPKGAAQNLLATLEARSYVQKLDARKYSLGIKLFELGAHFRNQLDIRRAALPELTSMVGETGQAGFLCIRDADYALCLERIEGRHFFHIFALGIGERQPLHCGAAPRALLAGMSEEEVLAYATRTNLPRYTAKTIGTPQALLQDIQRTRSKGYVVSEQDVSLDIAAVGVPIFDGGNKVVASVSLSGIAASYTPRRVEDLAETIKAAAGRISRRLSPPAASRRSASAR